MTHVVVGYPSLEDTKQLILTMIKNGVDMIELQIPFSDPVADGPTILKASQESLDSGTTVADAFMLVKELRDEGVDIPLLFMTYANIVHQYGCHNFIEKSVEVGIDGYIVPDLPFDTPEGKYFYRLATDNDQEMIPLFAPTMNSDRFEFVGNHAQNIIYAVSRTGVTGTKGFSADLTSYLEQVRSVTPKETAIALGFGIQSKEQIEGLKGKVEIAVIGSHILNIFNDSGLKGVEDFLQDILS